MTAHGLLLGDGKSMGRWPGAAEGTLTDILWTRVVKITMEMKSQPWEAALLHITSHYLHFVRQQIKCEAGRAAGETEAPSPAARRASPVSWISKTWMVAQLQVGDKGSRAALWVVGQSGWGVRIRMSRSHFVFHHNLHNTDTQASDTKPLTLYLVVYLCLWRRLHEGLRCLSFREAYWK